MRRIILSGAILLGFSAIITQILFLRECLSVLAGNELIVAIVLGGWLLITGFGSFLSRYLVLPIGRGAVLALTQLFMGILPLAQILLLRVYRGYSLPGVMFSLGEIFVLSLLLLLPYCLLQGMLLGWFSGALSELREDSPIAPVYLCDTLGGIAGGAIFTFLGVHYCSALEIACVLALLNGVSALLLYPPAAGVNRLGALKASLLTAVFAFCYPTLQELDLSSIGLMFPKQEIERVYTTPLGSLVIGRQDGQINVFFNGVLAGSSGDKLAAEETVHYAMAQRPEAQAVLLISGGIGGAIEEILKYSVAQVDYVELDPLLLEVARWLERPPPAVRLVADDARRFIRTRRERYDVILMSLPDPSSAQLNRYYTSEFFAEVRRALRPGGVFSFGLGAAENYAAPETRVLLSSIYGSLRDNFGEVLVIPGARQFFLSSAGSLSYDIADVLKARGIAARFVNEGYLGDRLSKDRLSRAVVPAAAVGRHNRDASPIAYYVNLTYWLRHFGENFLLRFSLLGLLALWAAVIISRSRSPALAVAVCTGGFASIGVEVLLLLGYQTVCGYIFERVGLIVSAFMVGSLAGAWCLRKRERTYTRVAVLDGLQAALALAVLASVALPIDCFWGETSAALIFAALNAAAGALVGAQFVLGAGLLGRQEGAGAKEVAAHLYSADYLGACLGALVTGVFMVPLVGLKLSCVFIACVKLGSAVFVWRCSFRRPDGPRTRGLPKSVEGRVLSLCLVAFVPAVLGFLIAFDRSNRWLRAAAFSPAYQWLLLAFAGWGIARAIGLKGGQIGLLLGGAVGWAERTGTALLRRSGITAGRWMNYVVFALVVFYPIFRCFFRIPYVFCRVCPHKCVFGWLRPYLVPAALVMNLERRYWCYHCCPIGTLHDCQTLARRKTTRLPAALVGLGFCFLAFAAVAYYAVWPEHGPGGAAALRVYDYFFAGAFELRPAVIVAAAGIFGLAFFYHRVFCEIVCPVGAFSKLALRIGQKLGGRRDSIQAKPVKAE